MVPPVAGNCKLARAPFSFAMTATWLTTPAPESLAGSRLPGLTEGRAHRPSARGSLWNALARDARSCHTCHPTSGTRGSAPGGPDEGIGTARPEHIPQTGPPGEARAETARQLQSPMRVPRGRSGRGKSLWAPARNCKRAGAASLKTSEHRGGGSRAREPRGSANQRRAAGAGGACGRAVNGARRSRRRPRREPARGRAHFLHSAGRGRRRQRQRRRQRRSAQLPSESAAGPALRGCEEPGRRAGHFPAR